MSNDKRMPELHHHHRERLRQAFLTKGIDAFPHDHQVLEVLLTYAIPRRDVNELAHLLVNRFGSLQGVLSASPQELMQVSGVGETSAVMLSLIGSLPKHIAKSDPEEELVLSNPYAVAKQFAGLFIGERRESVYVVSLDKNWQMLACDQIARGTVSAVPIQPRQVVESALRYGASSVILLHNHPSGDLTASEEDIRVTRLVMEALGSVGIPLRDHMIIGGTNAFSMVSNQVINLLELEESKRTMQERKAE